MHYQNSVSTRFILQTHWICFTCFYVYYLCQYLFNKLLLLTTFIVSTLLYYHVAISYQSLHTSINRLTRYIWIIYVISRYQYSIHKKHLDVKYFFLQSQLIVYCFIHTNTLNNIFEIFSLQPSATLHVQEFIFPC